MRLKYFTYLVFTFFSLSALASNEDLQQAKELFSNKKYKQSLELYQNLVDSTNHSANLYYNIGLCHEKMGNLSLSIWSYEKAVLYSPYHTQANAALEKQKELVSDDLGLSEDYSAFNKLARGIPGNYLFIIAVLISILSAIVIFIAVKKEKSGYYFFGFLGAGILICSILLLWTQKSTWENSGHGIVMKNCALKVSTDSESEDSFHVEEGMKLKLIEKDGDWYKVQVKSEQVFIPEVYLKKI